MSRRKIKAGSTSQILPVFIQDTSSTTGAGLGSLVYNTASLAAKYRRQGDSSWTAITLVTATAGTFTSGGFVADGGSVTGGYEIGLPNAMLAAGATWAQLQIYGAANMLAVLVEFELDAVDYQDTVRFGLTALPNVASGSAGAIITSGTGTAQLSTSSGQVLVQSGTGTGQVSLSSGAVIVQSGTGTGQISLSAGKVLLQATQTGVTIPTVTTVTNQLTAAQIATGVWQDTTAGDFNVASSIGKSLYTSGNAPGAASGLALVGSNMGTITGGTITTVSDKSGYSVSGTITTLDALNTSLSSTHGAGSWATATGFSTLDASGVRSAVGLASANLDTQLDALPTAAENSTAVWAAVTRSLTDKSGFSLATAPPTADENAAALLDLANAIESGLTVRQAMRLIVAADAGKVSGGGTTTVTIRDIADTKDRIVATVDSDGNRTAITRDLT